jgi:toxin ParE1/3/4
MKLAWTPQAIEDLSSLRNYIAQDNPGAADDMVATIVTLVTQRLSRFPHSGRDGRVEGTQEFVVPRTSYVVAYQITGDTVNILAVHHASQRWPEQF